MNCGSKAEWRTILLPSYLLGAGVMTHVESTTSSRRSQPEGLDNLKGRWKKDYDSHSRPGYPIPYVAYQRYGRRNATRNERPGPRLISGQPLSGFVAIPRNNTYLFPFATDSLCFPEMYLGQLIRISASNLPTAYPPRMSRRFRYPQRECRAALA
ncbi:hypothetical protein GGR54DRAFT_568010 [Hypoxylon sp. NC1633]|nr:hypothetical protein GGR54DRAFT_568010 [Hypoxylon sp. NC1633]